jgi:hypothetical protein
MATNAQQILSEADNLIEEVNQSQETPFYGEESRQAEEFLSSIRQPMPTSQSDTSSAEILKVLQESEELLKGTSTTIPFDSVGVSDGIDLGERPADATPIAPPVPQDPDSLSNRAGRSFNEFQKAAAEGIGVFGRLIESPEIENWAKENAAEQQRDIESYGTPRRTSSITKGMEEIEDIYEQEGLASAIERGAVLVQDMLGDAVGSAGPIVGASLAAVPIAAFSPVIGGAAALILPFMVGGLAGAGQIREEALKIGADTAKADEAAAIGGPIVGLLDKIGAGFMLKSLIKEFGKKAVVDELGKDVGKDVAESAVNKALKFTGQVAKGGLRGGIAEAATEIAQERTQIGAAGLAAEKGISPYQDAVMLQRLTDAGALGFVGGKAFGAGSSAIGTIVQKQAAQRAIELEEQLDDIAKGIKDQETELGNTFQFTGKGVFGRKRKDDPLKSRPLSSIWKAAIAPLGDLARRNEQGARIVNLLAQSPNTISAGVGQDADKVRDVFDNLKRSFRIPLVMREIPKTISKRVYKVMTTGEADTDTRINEAAQQLRTFFGNLPTDPDTGRVKLPVKLEEDRLKTFIFDGKILGDDPVLQALRDGDITQEQYNTISQEVQGLRNEYEARVQQSPNEEASIRRDILRSEGFKNLKNREIVTPQYDGFFGRLVEAGIPINFEEGYLPRVYKTGPLNRKKMIKVLMSRGKTKAAAVDITETIADNEGVYDNAGREIQLNRPTSNLANSSRISEEQARKLSKEDVQALEEAGLVETDIQALVYKYILDANRRINGKQMANEINEIFSNTDNDQISVTEREYINDVFDATQNKYKPLKNDKLKAIQKWGLTGQYILTLPLAGLTALSEPLIILSRIGPKYALFGTANAIYNSYRAGLRKFFPKFKLRESEKAFAGILQGLDGSLAERFGDLANVTVARKVTNAFFKATLLTTVTQISRDIAFQAARAQIRNDLKILKAGKIKTKDYKLAKRRLTEQGITNPDIEPVQQWLSGQGDPETGGDPTIIRRALSKTVDEFIMAPNAVNRPLWMSNPHLATVAQLKGFMFVFGNTVGARMWREVIVPLTRGRMPVADALRYGVALASIMAVAMAIQGLKDNIRYGDERSPFDELDGKDKLLEAVFRTNILGGFTALWDAIRAKKYGSSFLAAILGPTASTIETGAEGIGTFFETGKGRSLARWITGMVPILRNIPQARDIRKDATDNVQDFLEGR